MLKLDCHMELCRKKAWLVLLGGIVLGHVFGCDGCFQEEMAALLDFKATYGNESLLPSWVNDPKSNCCAWERVTCDSSTGHVIHLALGELYKTAGMRPYQYSYSSISDCFDINLRPPIRRFLNWSLFLSFRELTSLDLSNYCFRGFIPIADNSKSTLKKLETLDLSSNILNVSIMELVGTFPSIKNLNLARNSIQGTFFMKELSLLPNLEVLDVSQNFLVSPVTTQDTNVAFYVLKKLKTLDLVDNNFDKGILMYLVAFPSLRYLYLSGNSIKGLDDKVLANLTLSKLEVLELSDSGINASFPNQGLCKMRQLQELDLSQNHFRGTLDKCLGNLTSLRYLDLSRNHLSGNLAPFIAQLASIEYLDIIYNEFEGLFSLNIFGNHSKLKALAIGRMNSKTFRVETENPPWVAPFQLEQLDISFCEVNLPTKVIPTFLSNQSSLRYFDLSSNNLVGKFPSWLLVNNPNLEAVFINDNSFTGPLKLPLDLNHHMGQMHLLYLTNNQIQGKLPNNIGYFFPHLHVFDVSKNMFDGHIPPSIGEMSSLKALFMGNNNFSGEVSKHTFNGCFSLVTLEMDNNQLNGTLLSVIKNLRLTALTASRNNFEGAITDEWCQHELFWLDLSHNKFSGPLPSCFKMPSTFLLQGNSFTGTIPEVIIRNYSYPYAFDLSDNKFTGTIPDSIYKLWSLQRLLLAGNQLQGQLSSQICQLKQINILDLSRNNFTGSVPSCFNNMLFGNNKFVDVRPPPSSPQSNFGEVQFITKNSYLSYRSFERQKMSGLDLSSNRLTGEIPHQIGDLRGLHSLNLSYNHLNGPIPESFQKLESIESLDLSNNNLSGQIPLHLQDLHFLSIFNVSYNNLSGKAPDKGQFGTFDGSSYKGNPYLTWNNSNEGSPTPPLPPTLFHDGEEKDFAIDFTTFFWSFASSYVMVFISLVTILWINPHWRRVWFYFVQVCIRKCFGQLLEDAFY